jgi:hypothetical protein
MEVRVGRLARMTRRTPRVAAAARVGRSWRWAVVLVLSVSLVLLGPTSFPRPVDAACPGPDVMRDEDGYCIGRGELIVMTGEHSGGQTRADLEGAIAPLGGRIETAVDVAGIYGVVFPAANTLAELDEMSGIEQLRFW